VFQNLTPDPDMAPDYRKIIDFCSQERRQKIFQGGGGATEKDRKLVKLPKNSTIYPLPEGGNGKKAEK